MKTDFRWSLIDQIAAPVLILDQIGTIQFLNDDARDLLAISADKDIIGLDFSQFLSADFQKKFDLALLDVSDGSEIINHKFTLGLQAGRIFQ